MTFLIKTPTVRFSYYGRNLVIEQEGQKIVIERADLPEAVAAAEYVLVAEKVPVEEVVAARKEIAERTD